MHAERPAVFGDRQVFDARRFRGETRERGKPGRGQNDRREAELLGFCSRPRRGRGTRASGTVA
jgi:hypothetical protein